MKQPSNIKFIPLYFIILLFLVKDITTASMRESPYVGDTKVRHSLFVERDNKERMSIYTAGVPITKQE